jgi:UDPglucose--hexose-1-phosphate uridylyltransferase
MTSRLHIRRENLSDGRSLSLYGWHKHEGVRTDKLTAAPPAMAQIMPGILNWHPFKQDFVCTSPGRQNRTFKPAADQCPLCPTSANADHMKEIPFADFEVAVFDNRFPSYVLPEQAMPLDSVLRPAHGKCEVVVYSPQHEQTLATMTDIQRLLLIETWIHRYDTLLGLPGIDYVHVFENRGEAAGVTLFHPHGQIYALPYVPPVQQTMANVFQKDPRTLAKIIDQNPHLIVAEQDDVVAFCPEFGMFSYEIWIAPRTPRGGLWSFDRSERQALAGLLGQVATAYDKLFGKPMPYIMAIQSAPPRFEQDWHTHLTFYPLLRTADKLKYVAGVEFTTGHFLKDVTAAQAVATLKPLFATDF